MNKKSFQAALRFGFQHEGVFRNHQIVKDRNRDTAWFSITDNEWPAIKSKFERWLKPSNFDSHGRQHYPLSKIKDFDSPPGESAN